MRFMGAPASRNNESVRKQHLRHVSTIYNAELTARPMDSMLSSMRNKNKETIHTFFSTI